MDNIAGNLGVTNGSSKVDEGIDGRVHVLRNSDLTLTDQSHCFDELTRTIKEDKSGNVSSDGTNVEAVLNETTDHGSGGTTDICSSDGTRVSHTVKPVQQVASDGFLNGSIVKLTNGADSFFKTLIGIRD